MGTRPLVRPRGTVQAVPDRDAHQFVIGRVVLHLVDAVPHPVMGLQHRPVAVGQLTPALRLTTAGDGPSSFTSSRPHCPPSRISASMRTGEDAGL